MQTLVEILQENFVSECHPAERRCFILKACIDQYPAPPASAIPEICPQSYASHWGGFFQLMHVASIMMDKL